MIKVNNGLKDGWLGEYIGRGGKGKNQSPLANPFKISSKKPREAVIAEYKIWLWEQLQYSSTPPTKKLNV